LVSAITIGDGFVQPPRELKSIPVLHGGGTHPVDESEALAVINKVMRMQARPQALSLPAAIGGDAQIICTLPELDVYRGLRHSEALGPLRRPATLLPAAATDSVFFYLAAESEKAWQLLELMAEMGVPAHGFMRIMPPGKDAALAARGLRFYDTLQDMAEMLRASRLINHRGGIGVCEAALMSGRAQLLLPQHLEHVTNSKSLLQLGAAVVIGAPSSNAPTRDALHAAYTLDAVGTSAERVARKIAARLHDLPGSLEPIPTLCENAVKGDRLGRQDL
jgi:rhamnosyltransferase subunit B